MKNLSLAAVACFGSLLLGACSNSTGTQTAPSGSSPVAQGAAPGSAMPGMDHGSKQSPGAMPGMHGAMNMSLGPKNDTFDLRFIDAMIPHHQGAVTMAQDALNKSQRPEIKQLAQNIIAAQQKEIQELQEWRKAWYSSANSQPVMYDAQMKMDMPMSDSMHSDMMMQGDLGAADDRFDLRFIDAMTPHHQGAIDMAQQALQNSTHPELKQLAQGIIASQQQEIDQMKQWKQQWYGQ